MDFPAVELVPCGVEVTGVPVDESLDINHGRGRYCLGYEGSIIANGACPTVSSCFPVIVNLSMKATITGRVRGCRA